LGINNSQEEIMDELSGQLIDRLIEKTFENMDQGQRMAFVERLFSTLPVGSQERVVMRILQDSSPGSPGALAGGGAPHEFPPAFPRFLRHRMRAHGRGEFGPWGLCRRMLSEVDQASHLDRLDAARPARLFSALGDETRIKIVKLLSEGEQNVDDLTRLLDVSQPTISHHVRILRENGLVQSEKRGRSIYYSLVQPPEESLDEQIA
jgi:DNA-binding transcriptional ArsR family regulator